MTIIPARERQDYVAWHKANHSPKEHELFLAGGGHTPTEFLNPTLTK